MSEILRIESGPENKSQLIVSDFEKIRKALGLLLSQLPNPNNGADRDEVVNRFQRALMDFEWRPNNQDLRDRAARLNAEMAKILAWKQHDLARALWVTGYFTVRQEAATTVPGRVDTAPQVTTTPWATREWPVTNTWSIAPPPPGVSVAWGYNTIVWRVAQLDSQINGK